MMKRVNKKSIAALSLACVLSVTGISAYFTDSVENDATAKAGTMNLVFSDVVTTDDKTGDLIWGENITNFNPGDEYGLDYKLTNTGNKSMDVRQTLIVESSVEMTETAREFTLNGSEWALNENESTSTKLVYTTSDIILNGVGLTAETESSGIGEEGKTYDLDIIFASSAKNAFQNADITVNYRAEAKQHRNTEAGWDVIAEFEVKN